MSKPLHYDSVICVSDVHGSYLTLMELLCQHGAGRQLILLGDLIDRGPRSREVVEYAMEHAVPTVMGNHESLCLAYSKHAKLGYDARCSRYYAHDIWTLANGGRETLDSWGTKTLPREVLDWMAALPPYLIIDTPNAAGQKLLCSHTGYGLSADKGDWLTALWGRYPGNGAFVYENGTGEPMDDGYLRVFGHTRCVSAIVTDTYANIDTGVAYGGKLTGMLWPEMTLVEQERLD